MGRKSIYGINRQMCVSSGKEGIASLPENTVLNRIIDAPSNILFSALKYVEHLYKNGKIQEKDFREILIEYADRVDTGYFLVALPEPIELLKEESSCTM